MKKTFFLLILLLNVVFVFAQTTDERKIDEKKNTCSLLFFANSGIDWTCNYRTSIVSGLSVKHHFKYFSLRLRLEEDRTFYLGDIHPTACMDATNLSGFNKNYGLSAGIEKRFRIGKHIAPYIALEAIGVKSHGNIISTGGWGGNLNERDETYGIGFGGAPVLGIDFKLTKYFSIGGEVRAAVLYSIVTNHSSPGENISSDPWVTIRKGYEELFLPFGVITFSFNF